jgi:hypothetical protein
MLRPLERLNLLLLYLRVYEAVRRDHHISVEKMKRI